MDNDERRVLLEKLTAMQGTFERVKKDVSFIRWPCTSVRGLDELVKDAILYVQER
jgi:hypothetical protein